MQRNRVSAWGGKILLGIGILWGSGCAPSLLGPTQPSGYRVQLPQASQTLRAHPLALTVQVRDSAGQPVEDVEVHFRIPPTWTTQARVDPPTVVTQHGQATTTFRAHQAGQMAVEITVEDRTDTVTIVVQGDSPRF